MAQKKDAAPQPQGKSEQAAAGTEGPGNLQARIQQAYLDHLQALQNLSWDLQKRQGEALARCTEQLRSELKGVSLADAQRSYVQTVQEASGRGDATRATEAGRELMGVVQEAQTTAQRSYENATRQYAETVKQAWDDAQRQLRDQYLAYSRALQDAWAQANQGDPDPQTLVLLSQSLLAAALTAPPPAR
jgi:transcriptional regulator with AAA-type ATPase domain